MADASMRWRELTAGELAAEPGARFGGAIMVIFFAAVLVLLVLLTGIGVWLASGDYRYALGVTFAMVRGILANSAFGSWLALMGVIELLLVEIWAAVFVVAVVWRLRAGATIAAILFVACTLTRPVGVMIMYATLGTTGIAAGITQIPSLAWHLVAAVAYRCYMCEGWRPNLYFRRRLRRG
jgi:hypothetical protein